MGREEEEEEGCGENARLIRQEDGVRQERADSVSSNRGRLEGEWGWGMKW